MCAVTLALFGAAGFTYWTRQRDRLAKNDSQTSYYWESCLEQMIGKELPVHLRPPWHRCGQTTTGDTASKRTVGQPQDDRTAMLQILVTFMLVGLLALSLLIRAQTPEPVGRGGGPVVEQSSMQTAMSA
jgi:hypothetical protein